jgi:hypothetical protein
MLEDASKNNFEAIVSWQSGGKSFKVIQPQRFASEIMQTYFNQTKYKSFQRQLNIYGFRRVHLGPNKGGYSHKYFNRCSPELSDSIVRPLKGFFNSCSAADEKKNSLQMEPIRLIDRSSSFRLSSGDLKLDDSEVKTFYDFFYPEDPKETSLVLSSIFDQQEGSTKDGNSFSMEDESSAKREAISFLLSEKDHCPNHDNYDHDHEALFPASFLNQQDCSKKADTIFSMDEDESSALMEEISFLLRDEDGRNHDDDDDDELSSSEHTSFPWKLHLMLEHAEKKNYHDVVSWVKDGSAFKVHKSREFVEQVMPIYFDQTKYESFRRQLNLYGFTRMSRGEDRSVTSHPSFVKGARCLCENIRRKLS